jgi:pimeloyl-ACP methyl ester carboxylesterase
VTAARGIEHSFVDTELGPIHLATTRADAGRWFVLIHQVPSSHLMWSAVMARLARDGVGCVAVDLPGFGFSPRPVAPPSIEDYASATGTALEMVLEGSWLAVGHHAGCVVALALANQRPERVRGVAGYGIPLVSEQRRRELATEAFVTLSAGGEEVAAYWHARRRRGGASPEVADTARSLAEWLLAGDYAVWGHRAVGSYDTAGALARVSQPLLGMAGRQEDLYEDTRRAVQTAPDGRFVSLGSAGIDVADTSVEAFCDALMHFDDSIPTSHRRRET